MAKKTALELFHKETISSAADRLFSEHGMEKTTMDDIAKEAEYSKATIYVYFKSKEEIFHYIILKGMKLLHTEFEKVLSDKEDAIDAYFSACHILAAYCNQYPLYFDSILETIASDEYSRKKSNILDEIYQIGEVLNQDVAALMQRGIEQGVFQNDLPHIPTGLVHWSALSGIISIANKKQSYIGQRTGMSKNDFLSFGYRMMLKSILKPEIEIDKERFAI